MTTEVQSSNDTNREVNYLPTGTDVEVEEFLYKLPKIELHVHLDGAFDPELIFSETQKKQSQNNHDVTESARKILLKYENNRTSFVEDCKCRGKRSFQEMIKSFETFIPLVQGNISLIERLSHDFVKRQADDNIIYTEVRYCPHLLAIGGTYTQGSNDDTNVIGRVADNVVDAVTRGLRLGEEEYGVKVNQILCCLCMRPDWSHDIVRIAKERRARHPCAVVGIDIAAGEDHFQVQPKDHLHLHRNAFEKANECHLNVSMHAGEIGPVENIVHAVSNYNAVRIGHGYRIVQDEIIMQKMKKLNIHFEICPTSSVETGAWKYQQSAQGKTIWKDHPCTRMQKYGLNIGFNSDDPSVFDTSLSWQFRIAYFKMGISLDTLKKMNLQALEAAFISNKEKDLLKQKIKSFQTNSVKP